MRSPHVYIMTNKPHGVLYTGVTTDLARRVTQHRAGEGSDFCKRYNLDKLVWFEAHERIDAAIAREKAIKAWLRVWKLRLIAESNPTWRDLYGELHLV